MLTLLGGRPSVRSSRGGWPVNLSLEGGGGVRPSLFLCNAAAAPDAYLCASVCARWGRQCDGCGCCVSLFTSKGQWALRAR